MSPADQGQQPVRVARGDPTRKQPAPVRSGRAGRLVRRVLDGVAARASRTLAEGSAKARLRSLRLRRFASFLPMRDLVSPGEVVAQVGCWRIETVEELAKAVSGTGRVIVIEPDRLNTEVLELEIGRRQIDNVTIVRKAAWSCRDTLSMRTSSLSMLNRLAVNATIDPWGEELYDKGEVAVEADSIDNILADLGVAAVGHLHITANGSEVEAIEGMSETLSRRGVRVFIRALAMMQGGERPANEVIAEMLEERGLTAILARDEPEYHGGNVYAWRP